MIYPELPYHGRVHPDGHLIAVIDDRITIHFGTIHDSETSSWRLSATRREHPRSHQEVWMHIDLQGLVDDMTDGEKAADDEDPRDVAALDIAQRMLAHFGPVPAPRPGPRRKRY
jgi:hypothetical protein